MISRQRVPRGRLSLQGLNKRCDLRFATPLFTLHSTLATPHSSLLISYSSHYYKVVYSIVRHTTYHNVQCTLQYVVCSTQYVEHHTKLRTQKYSIRIRNSDNKKSRIFVFGKTCRMRIEYYDQVLQSHSTSISLSRATGRIPREKCSQARGLNRVSK